MYELLQEMARDHWKQWRPIMYQAKVKAGTLETDLQEAADKTVDMMCQMMENGTTQYQAREVAFPAFLLLEPEPASLLD